MLYEVITIVGYAITNQAMAMEAALVLLDKGDREDGIRSLLEESRDQSRESLAEVRAALYRLREQRAPYLDSYNFV